jgi:hypothetical protein
MCFVVVVVVVEKSIYFLTYPRIYVSEPSGFIKGEEEFLDYLSDYQLLKKDPAPWS